MSVLIEPLGIFSYSKCVFLPSLTPTQLEYPLSGFKTLNYYRCGVMRVVTEDQRGHSIYLMNVFKCIISLNSHDNWGGVGIHKILIL